MSEQQPGQYWRMQQPMPRRARDASLSEHGLFELVGRQTNLPVRDVLIHLRDLVSSDMAWADSRKKRNRRRAFRVRIASLALASSSTVVLGIDAIPANAQIALPMVALVTLLGAVDAFFNWRSHWTLMEETLYRLNQLRDEIDYYLVVTPPDDVDRETLDQFSKERQLIWLDVNRRGLEFRSSEMAQTTPTIAPGAMDGA